MPDDRLTPAVSVVVATRDRAARLRGLLGALRDQTLDPSRFELIVVDDGSTDGTAELLAAERGKAPFGLSVVRGSGQGPAAARNAGWRRARAPLVAFTDDDCEPAAVWLDELLRAAGGRPGGIVQGPTRPIERERELLGRPFARTRRIEEPNPWYATCNIAYPRELLERLGGFDERFPDALGEDTDLGWRARELGARLEFAPNAVVHHAVELQDAGAFVRSALRGADAVYAFRRHPGLRAEALRLGIFRGRSQALLAVAAAGLVASRAWRPALLMCLPYAGDVFGRARHLGDGPSLAPPLVAHDLLHACTSLRGSLRHRTLVL